MAEIKTINPYTDLPGASVPPEDPTLNAEGGFGVFNQMQVGSGSVAYKMDRQGFWLGGRTFADAIFSVDMYGNLVAKSATIAGYKLFEAVVGPSNADYSSVYAAITAGKTRIFVRNGTYTNEPKWVISNANTVITGESYGGVDIQFAEDTAEHIHIKASQVNFVFQNLKLTANESSDHDLIKLIYPSAQYGIVDRCILKNRRSKYFNTDNSTLKSYLTVKDTRFDLTSLGSSYTPNIYCFYSINDALVINSFVDANVNYVGTGWYLFYSCNRTFVSNSKFVDVGTNDMHNYANAHLFFNNCFFGCSNIISDAHHIGCSFQNNASSNSGYFIYLTPSQTTFVDNRVKCPVDMDVLLVDAANNTITGNFFEDGKNIVIQNASLGIKGIIFSNNNWVSGYTSAAIVLTIGTNISVSNIIGNIIRNNSNSFTPVLTDSGTGNNVAYNQLIKG